MEWQKSGPGSFQAGLSYKDVKKEKNRLRI